MLLLALVQLVPLAVGARMTSFEPFHLTGPSAGGPSCPICTWVDAPAVQIWTDASPKSLDAAFMLAAEIEGSPTDRKAFLIVDPTVAVNDADLVRRSKGLKKVWVTRLASKEDPAVGFHRFTPGVGPLVLVYAKRRTTAVLVGLDSGEASRLRLRDAL